MCHRLHFDAAAQRSFKGRIGLISHVVCEECCYHSTIVLMIVI